MKSQKVISGICPHELGLGVRSLGRLGLPVMNLAVSFARAAEKAPRKTALYWGEREYSFEELLQQTSRVASHLQHQLGLKPGDRVGLWLKNCPEFIPAL